MKHITVNYVLSRKPCSSWTLKRIEACFDKREVLTPLEVAALNIEPRDILWLLLHEDIIPPRELRLIACREADLVLDREETSGRAVDPRSREAIRTARAFADGKATKEELIAARDAVWNAAWDADWNAGDIAGNVAGAAGAAALDAAEDAAEAVVKDAAEDAAWAAAVDAALDATWAAEDAALDAAMDAAEDAAGAIALRATAGAVARAVGAAAWTDAWTAARTAAWNAALGRVRLVLEAQEKT